MLELGGVPESNRNYIKTELSAAQTAEAAKQTVNKVLTSIVDHNLVKPEIAANFEKLVNDVNGVIDKMYLPPKEVSPFTAAWNNLLGAWRKLDSNTKTKALLVTRNYKEEPTAEIFNKVLELVNKNANIDYIVGAIQLAYYTSKVNLNAFCFFSDFIFN
jgi:hypothetical protein